MMYLEEILLKQDDESTNEEFFVDGEKERYTDIIKESFLMPKQGSGKLLKESYREGKDHDFELKVVLKTQLRSFSWCKMLVCSYGGSLQSN